MSNTVPLNEAARLGIDLVGAKAATLADLAARNTVPDGFVILASAFVEHFERQGVSVGGRTNPAAAAPDDAALARLRGMPLEAELAGEVQRAYSALPLADGRPPTCVVRSSAVGEDGAHASFAGQHATYYYVERADVEQRIIDCWLSVWSDEATSYRQQLAPDEPVRMAVIVQLMVPAEVSGVAFTIDPTGRQRDAIVIESCWGLGAALVDGRVTPDSYVVRRSSHEILERRLGSKRFKVAEDLLDPVGTRLQLVPRHLQRTASLTDAQALAVASLAAACEAQRGSPQDVEWAYANGTLYLLQSRPISTAAHSTIQPEGRWVAFKPVLENFTEALTPLCVDILRRVVPPFGRFIDGRYYLDFDMLRRWAPIDVTDTELVELALLKSERSDYRVNWSRLSMLVGIGALAYVSTGLLWVRSRHLPAASLAEFRKRCAAILAQPDLDAVASLRALLLGPNPFAAAAHFPFEVNVSATRYFFLLAGLRWFLRRYAPRFDLAQIAPLCAGTREMLSTQLIDDLRETALVAEHTPAIRQLLQSDRLEELPNQLAVHPAAAPFVASLESFIAQYGHRGTREIELAAPRWQEDPTPLFVMIRNLLREGFTEPLSVRATLRNAQAEAALDAALPGRFKRGIARWLVRRIRYYAALRENTRHYTMLALTTVRQKVLVLEQQLLRQGALKCADDIFYLTWDEVSALLTAAPDRPRLQSLIRRRRLTQLRRNRLQPPLTINVDYHPPPRAIGVLLGQCASPGIAEGTVRLVLDPATDGEIRSGEILVAPYTDPAWTPLFLGAAAIVVETGSYLSHAGTIARELGIPCLVDVAGVMTALRNGQRICVDATQGKAFLLADMDGQENVSP
jgi:phosphohistidine swiveling domain-containing protein